MLDIVPGLRGHSSPARRDSQEMKKTMILGSLWEGGLISGQMCSRRTEREHLEEWFSIFNCVIGVGFIVKQRLSEDLREGWEGGKWASLLLPSSPE